MSEWIQCEILLPISMGISGYFLGTKITDLVWWTLGWTKKDDKEE